MNPYEILGVEKDATADVIKKAYRKLSKEHHPDVGGDSEKFKEIASAYDILSNSDKKQKYDTFGDAEASFGSNPFGGNPFDFINQFFGGASSMGRQVRKGDDILVTVKMNLMEILLGANKQITYIRDSNCETCNGVGGDKSEKCTVCNGSGEVLKTVKTSFGIMHQQMPCSSCNSNGYIINNKCKTCKGKGVTAKNESLTVTIPAGVHNGMQFPKNGAGNVIKNGTPGNLFIKIEEIPDNNFKREIHKNVNGDYYTNNLIHDLYISISDAVLGDEKIIKAPLGDLKIKIEPGCESGKVYKITGKGIPNPSQDNRGYGAGDMYIKVNVKIPKILTDETREIFENLKKYE